MTPDYGVTKVAYNEQHTHIVQVELRRIAGDGWENPTRQNRQYVVNLIRAGNIVFTAVLRDGAWQWGAKIEIIRINGVEYLRTDANRQAADNLGSLPEFEPQPLR